MEGIAAPRILTAARTKSRRAQAAIEQTIKAFFGGNALVAVIVLALITIFLFREGFGFFGQNLANLRLYRQAGLEYVDIIRSLQAEHEALSRKLSDIRLRQMRAWKAARFRSGKLTKRSRRSTSLPGALATARKTCAALFPISRNRPAP